LAEAMSAIGPMARCLRRSGAGLRADERSRLNAGVF
jgi:hypothetical protein